MWVYYGLILLSVGMFGGGFAIQDLYRKNRGSGLGVSMESACIGAFAGLLVLLLMNGFSIEFTWFTLLMAGLSAMNGMAFTFCAFKALDYINLSLFSLFTMLGGMVLPFLQGILFYGESITLGKGVCVLFICMALLCTVEKDKKKKGGIFYAGIFVLNGLSGVISKVYTASTLPKSSAAGYSLWIAALTVGLSGVVWFVCSRAEKQSMKIQSDTVCSRRLLRSYGLGALNGVVNRVANFLLVIALIHVDASVQYPMVTGGTMIVSTIFSCLGDRRPTGRELFSVAMAFAGMLFLFCIPF